MTEVGLTVPPDPLRDLPTGAFIGGQWVAPRGAPLSSVDPATGRRLTTFGGCDEADVDTAVATALTAFEWHRTTRPAERERWLRALAERLRERADLLARITTLDMGMPIELARAQVLSAAELCEYTAGWATKLYGDVAYPSTQADYHAFTEREPLGVVAAIVPWNAPLLLTMLKLAPAIATGNSVVIKPSEEATLPLLALAQAVADAGLPDGLVNVVPGLGHTAGAALAAHRDVAKISVTGSVATGQRIVELSAGNLKRVTLELGGKSPNIVCADADLDIAVSESGWGVFAFSGQLCVAGTRILVHRSRYEEFTERLGAYARGLKVGNGFDPGTQIGPLVSARQLDRATGYVQRAAGDGARLVATGNPPAGDACDGGFFMPPVVFADVDNASELGREEVFGPVASVLPFDDLDEAVRIANDTPFGLAAGLYTNDVNQVHRVSRRLRAGVVWVNGYLASDPSVPFGGSRMSGYGREKGRQVIEDYTELKSVWIRLR
ncbi:aldehyde dehydrogenase family protein [Streptomyces sp. NPDC057580]|uniref:aldehyde dehydrogenase family protein n=1 Tax=Streptomyces sp. NPDC057580 TaxID=3346173 RepID=UPI0036B83270